MAWSSHPFISLLTWCPSVQAWVSNRLIGLFLSICFYSPTASHLHTSPLPLRTQGTTWFLLRVACMVLRLKDSKRSLTMLLLTMLLLHRPHEASWGPGNLWAIAPYLWLSWDQDTALSLWATTGAVSCEERTENFSKENLVMASFPDFCLIHLIIRCSRVSNIRLPGRSFWHRTQDFEENWEGNLHFQTPLLNDLLDVSIYIFKGTNHRSLTLWPFYTQAVTLKFFYHFSEFWLFLQRIRKSYFREAQFFKEIKWLFISFFNLI